MVPVHHQPQRMLLSKFRSQNSATYVPEGYWMNTK
jgi:hypothetical protein